MTILLLPFQFGFLVFPFLVRLLWLRLPVLCQIKVARVVIFVLFLLSGMFSAFHQWVWCWLWVCHIYPFLSWGKCPLYPLCWEFFFFLIINECWIISKSFSVSIEMTISFFFFIVLIWCITLISLLILNNLSTPGIN